jgi:hypothetical protein
MTVMMERCSSGRWANCLRGSDTPRQGRALSAVISDNEHSHTALKYEDSLSSVPAVY